MEPPIDWEKVERANKRRKLDDIDSLGLLSLVVAGCAWVIGGGFALIEGMFGGSQFPFVTTFFGVFAVVGVAFAVRGILDARKFFASAGVGLS
ncbi:MAG TPA: hypothetical protein VMZ71_12540 [Gemmataceae bacterium]|nr:hypothetical protein [Gemmataceae bacterium]